MGWHDGAGETYGRAKVAGVLQAADCGHPPPAVGGDPGGLLLAAYCIYRDYAGALPWLSAMVGLPWTAHGVVCSCYLSMAKSDHRRGGITYESAKAAGFGQDSGSENSPAI